MATLGDLWQDARYALRRLRSGRLHRRRRLHSRPRHGRERRHLQRGRRRDAGAAALRRPHGRVRSGAAGSASRRRGSTRGDAGLRRRCPSLSEVAFWRTGPVNLTGDGEAVRVGAGAVSATRSRCSARDRCSAALHGGGGPPPGAAGRGGELRALARPLRGRPAILAAGPRSTACSTRSWGDAPRVRAAHRLRRRRRGAHGPLGAARARRRRLTSFDGHSDSARAPTARGLGPGLERRAAPATADLVARAARIARWASTRSR